jgi:hypothetical protein
MFCAAFAVFAEFSTGVPQLFVEASSIHNNYWLGLSSKHAGKSISGLAFPKFPIMMGA